MGLNCMLDKKRKNNVQKIHFQMFGMFFRFCYVIWTAILLGVRPAFLKEGGA